MFLYIYIYTQIPKPQKYGWRKKPDPLFFGRVFTCTFSMFFCAEGESPLRMSNGHVPAMRANAS